MSTVVREGRPDEPAVAALLADFGVDIARRYGDAEPWRPPTPPRDYAPPVGAFVVVEQRPEGDAEGEGDGDVVAVGGLRRDPYPGGGADVGELKRVYVAPHARGNGHARRVVAALVQAGRALGYARLRLETGTGQPEAMGLYAALGWTPVPPYGEYAAEPSSRCFALDLAADGSAAHGANDWEVA